MVGKCKYNTTIDCQTRDCRQCGWNSKVSNARLEKFRAERHRPPSRVIDIDKYEAWLKETHPDSKRAKELVEEYWNVYATM